jgi:hypothetical protein
MGFHSLIEFLLQHDNYLSTTDAMRKESCRRNQPSVMHQP